MNDKENKLGLAFGERKFGMKDVVIIYGETNLASAQYIAEVHKKLTGIELPVVSDLNVVEGRGWQIKKEWTTRSMILLGSIYDNKVILALAGKLFSNPNASYPGQNGYILRTIFEPLTAGSDFLVVGAVDAKGLKKGMNRLISLIRKDESGGKCFFPATIEAIDGQDKPLRPIRRSTRDFLEAVEMFYWHGDLSGAKTAREFLLADMENRSEKDGLWGFMEGDHYRWESHYRALRQFIATGYLNEKEIETINRRLVRIAFNTTDSYGMHPFRSNRVGVMSRHLLAGFAGQYVLHEYLANVARLDRETKEKVIDRYAHLRRHIDYFLEDSRHKGTITGTEGMDVVCNLAGLYLDFGDERVLTKDIFRDMALYYVTCIDNLGYAAGIDSYIGSGVGSHFNLGSKGGSGVAFNAFFNKDPQSVWLINNMHGFSFGGYLFVKKPPAMFTPAPEIKATPPSDYIGITVAPLDTWHINYYKNMPTGHNTATNCASVPIENESASEREVRVQNEHKSGFVCLRNEDANHVYGKAAFRDGFDKKDAYLLLQGENIAGGGLTEGIQGNAIVRYTEFGSLLLYQNTRHQDSWARSVVSISNGKDEPQSPICIRNAIFKSPVVSGFSSTMQENGGTSWTRHIIRRHNGYFAVLDELTARENRQYYFTCRWRSFHSGGMEGTRRFVAMDGMNNTRLNIVSSEPLTAKAAMEDIDGSAAPTMLRQHKSAELRSGQTISFQNLIYAENDTIARHLDAIRLDDRTFMINGSIEGNEVTDLAAVGRLEFGGVISGNGRLWHLSDRSIAGGGCQILNLTEYIKLTSEKPFGFVLSSDENKSFLFNDSVEDIKISYTLSGNNHMIAGGRVLKGTGVFILSHGIQAWEFPDKTHIIKRMKSSLTRTWSKLEKEKNGIITEKETNNGFYSDMRVLSTVMPERKKHRTIHVSASPEPNGNPKGNPANWIGRQIAYNMPWCGWKKGTSGIITLDLHQPVDIHSVRLVWPRAQYEAAVVDKSQIEVKVSLSDDNFDRDKRDLGIRNAGLEIFYAELIKYMATYRYPVTVVPVGEKASHIKLEIRPSAEFAARAIRFQEIEVETEKRKDKAGVKLALAKGKDLSYALAWTKNEIYLIDAQKGVKWWKRLPSPLASAPTVADINSDGSEDIVIYTLDEALLAYDIDGRQLFRVSLYELDDGPKRGMTTLRPTALAAWRPDKKNHLEYAFFPHVCYCRVSPAPELKFSVMNPPMWRTMEGGKFAFAIPDTTGDGKDDLAVVGLYGMRFGVVDSGSNLEAGQLNYIVKRNLTGYSSGNMQMPLYFDGSVVTTNKGNKKWLGVVAINPGGIDYFSAPDFSPVMSVFNHPPNTCHALWDTTGSGVPELFVGREDGFVAYYDLTQFARKGSIFSGGKVHALAAHGEWMAVGGEGGLLLFNRKLQVVGHLPGIVDSILFINNMLIIAYEDGKIVSMHLRSSGVNPSVQAGG